MARKLQRRMCWRNPPKMSQAASTKLAEKPRGILNSQMLVTGGSGQEFFSFSISSVEWPGFGICKLIINPYVKGCMYLVSLCNETVCNTGLT